MAVERKTGGFGARLREAREQKGVSLREISSATKISTRALEALERNDISQLPGGIFSRGFVRSYAIQAGLDPEATVEEFVRHFPDDSVTAGHPPSRRIDDVDLVDSDRQMASVVVWLVGLSVPIVAALLYFGTGHRSATVAAPSTSRPPTTAGSAATRADGALSLTVEIVASRSAFISAAVDRQPPMDVQLEAGGRRRFEAGRELLLKIPDPAAVAWTINGSSGRGLGRDPATVLLTLDNYKDYLASR